MSHQGRRTTDFKSSLSVRLCICIGRFSRLYRVLQLFRQTGGFSRAENPEGQAQEVTVIGEIFKGLHLGALPDAGVAAGETDAGENRPAQTRGARRELEVA